MLFLARRERGQTSGEREHPQFAGNVVYGHTHRAQSETRRPVARGDIGAWNPGCLCQQQPLWQHTRPTDWTLGYGVQIVDSRGGFLHINVGSLTPAPY
jgi:hypothetical protein